MKKFLYIHVHKTGGTSLKSMMRGCRNVDFVERADFDKLSSVIDVKYRDHFKFALVRDPYSRFQSNFSMFKRRYRKTTFDEVIDIINDPTIPYTSDKFFGKQSYIKRHTLPMSHPFYCVVKDDKIIIDKVYRFENFNQTVEEISDLIDYDLKMKKMNKAKKPHDLLSIEQREIIKEIYKKDFEIFNYFC